MRKIFRKYQINLHTALIVVLAMLFGSTSEVVADTVFIAGGPGQSHSSEGIGSFTGSINYEFSGGIGTLIVELTNTSPESNGGVISGFLFNINGDASASLTSATLESGDRTISWLNSTGNDLSMPPPKQFGTFENGAHATSPPPVNGVRVGETGIFQFEVIGSDASALTAMDFMSESARDNRGNYTDALFGVRFQSFDDENSDKVEGVLVVVPLPGPVYMAGIGLFGVICGRKRMGRLIIKQST